MYEEGEYSSSSTALVAEADCYSTLETISRKKGNNKRRFSDDQIKSLETMFDSDTKLEPRKKLQVAKELGLQPRQVAIWFQNKRARWKSKQLEKDYSILQAKYDNLTSQFDILQKEKQSLATQLQKLYDRVERSDEENQDKFRTISGNNKSEYEMKPDALSLSGSEYGLGVLSDDDSITKAEYFKLEEPDLFNIVEVDPADGSLTSSEDWEKLESSVILDQSGSDCQWWDFWS